MNWTQPKSFASKFHGQCRASERDVLKGKGGEGGGGEGINAHVWVRILFPITVIEFDF